LPTFIFKNGAGINCLLTSVFNEAKGLSHFGICVLLLPEKFAPTRKNANESSHKG
jgi:hypothetical protein